jgi:hypothetical protein
MVYFHISEFLCGAICSLMQIVALGNLRKHIGPRIDHLELTKKIVMFAYHMTKFFMPLTSNFVLLAKNQSE